MLRLNLKIAWRTLWKNKSYTFINVLGLAIGLTGCMLIFIFTSYQLSYDKGYENSDRIYRFVTNWQYPSYSDFSKGVPIPMVAAAKNELAGIEKGSILIKRGGIVHIKDGSGKDVLKSRESFYYAEPEFFDIFQRKWLKGEPLQALSAPNSVSLSEQTAIKYFGSVRNAIDKSITIGNNLNLKVTGIFQDSKGNSSFPLNIVISYSTFDSKKYIVWDAVSSATEFYVLLTDGQTPESMERSIAAFNKKYYTDAKISGGQNNTLQPLNEIHFDPRYGSFAETTVSKKEIYGLGVIGLFLILTACINFINLSTAQASSRSREVGIRKVMGGARKQLFIQFLAETLSITLISMVIACMFTELAIPKLSDLLKVPASFSFLSSPYCIGFMIIIVIAVGFLSGFYPAVIISGFSPVLAIKNRVAVNAGGLTLRRCLVVLQFSITIILLIATFVVMKQMTYLREKPLGFNAQTVAMIALPGDSLSQSKYASFKTEAMQIPGLKLISLCQTAPSSEDITTSEFSYNGKANGNFELRNAKADANYFALFELPLVAGKAFGKDDDRNRAVVNETFVQKMGITDPGKVIGQVLNTNGTDMLITGVVKDYNDLSLKQKISPLVIYPQKGEYYSIAVKLETADIMSVMQQVESLWNKKFPDYVYQSSFLQDDLDRYYESEKIMRTLFQFAATVIIFISLIGLFGLISFVAAQRSREVAIRKVLGASTMQLVSLLSNSFFKMVLLANLFAWPLAYLFVSKWLQGFAYRIDVQIWPFIGALLVSLTLTLITVSIKSYLTAVGNMIETLKYE